MIETIVGRGGQHAMVAGGGSIKCASTLPSDDANVRRAILKRINEDTAQAARTAVRTKNSINGGY